jgi:hypothetical protein
MSQGSLPARAAVRVVLLSALVISGPGRVFAAAATPPPPSPAASAASGAIDERTRLLAEGPMRRILAAGSATPAAPVVVRVTPPINPTPTRPKPANPNPPTATMADAPTPEQGAPVATAATPTLPLAAAESAPAAAATAAISEPSSPAPSATTLAGETAASQPTPNAPRLIHTEPIELPESISRRLRGPVDLTAELMISEAGQVTWVNLPQVPFPALRAPVAAAIKEWQFAPLPTLTAHRLTVRLTASD